MFLVINVCMKYQLKKLNVFFFLRLRLYKYRIRINETQEWHFVLHRYNKC